MCVSVDFGLWHFCEGCRGDELSVKCRYDAVSFDSKPYSVSTVMTHLQYGCHGHRNCYLVDDTP